MTAAPPVDRAAASRLVAALEHAWSAIRTWHPDVPQVVIVVASGSDPRSRRLNLGDFAAGRWQLTSPDQPTDRAEVLVSGEGLQRGPVDVLGTLLHEAAHGLPMPARSATPAARAATTTAATPPSPRSSTWTSPTSSRSAGRRPASPSRPPPAMPRCWSSWPRRWCCGAAPSRPAPLGRAAPATPWPAPAPAVGASGWPVRCWSLHRSCAAPALSCSNPTTPIDAYASMVSSRQCAWPRRHGVRWRRVSGQPRAVDAGQRGLGRPARHNASAATGAARGHPAQP